MKLLLISIISITASIQICYAQSRLQANNTIKCQVIDSTNYKEIPFANVFNESQKTWVYAKENGDLTIWASFGDTLVISAIGYYDKLIILNDSELLNHILSISLSPRIYEIGEATVKGIKSYSQFKQDVVNLDLPKTKLDSVSENIAIISKKVVQKAEYDRMVDEVFARPEGTLFMLGTPFKTKQQKDRKKLKNKKDNSIIHQKLNRKVVTTYTNLKDSEILDFIIFCDFSDEFILNASEYEIAEALKNKLITYQQSKTQKN